MNKHTTMMLAALMMLFMATTALAVPPPPPPMTPCLSDDDCEKGEICELSDCPATDCDPDDPDCKPVDCEEEGWCLSLGTNMPTPSSECDTDADCPNGFSCDVVGSMGTACACAEGEEDCPCDDEPTKTEDWKECRPKACTTDAECGDGLQCHLYEEECPPTVVLIEDCPEDNPDCNKDIPNDPPKGEDCEPTTKGMCGPTWIGTCEAAADCGPGFDCAPVEICECSGSSISTPTPVEPTDTDGEGDDDGTDDGASSDPSPTPGGDGPGKADEASKDDEDCDCKPTDESYCQIIKVTCETDGDCTNEGWTCIEAGNSGGTCTFDVETGEEDCEETKGEKVCVPPGFEAWVDTYNDLDEGSAVTLGGGKDSIDNESANPPTAGPESDTGSGGCHVGGGVATGLLPLAIFMLLLVFRRRVQHS